MPAKAKVIPEGYHTMMANLVVDDAATAIDFYTKGLGAKEVARMPGPDGGIMHAELDLGDSRFMLGEEKPDMNRRSPNFYNGSPVSFYIYVENIDQAWRRAIDAGAKSVSPPSDMFWGDRAGTLRDPFGHSWMLAQHVADPTPEEMQKAQEAFFARSHATS